MELQSKEFSDGLGLEMYEYKFRFYDHQIGRFISQDRLAEKYAYYSPYQFAGNQVPNAIDLDGLEPYLPNYGVQLQLARESPGGEKAYLNNNFREGVAYLKALKAAALTLTAVVQPYIGGPLLVADLTGAPVIPSPAATESIVASEGVSESITASESANSESSYVFGDQWGGELYSTTNKTTTILGTRQGYWGDLTGNAEKAGLNLVANEANPSGFSYLNVDATGFDFSTAEGRQAFFDAVNKPFIDNAVKRGDVIRLLDSPFEQQAIYPKGDVSKGFNFYGMEVEYLKSTYHATFENGVAVIPH
jgi:RHS repeat-associated protein